MAQYFEQYRQSLEKMLYEPGKINDWFTLAETKTGVKRIYMALGKRYLIYLSFYCCFINFFFLFWLIRSNSSFINLLGLWLWGPIGLQCNRLCLSSLRICQGYWVTHERRWYEMVDILGCLCISEHDWILLRHFALMVSLLLAGQGIRYYNIAAFLI